MSATTAVRVRFTGSIAALSAEDRAALLDRVPCKRDRDATAAIIADIRHSGDDALRRMAERFDGVTLMSLEVSRAARADALRRTEPSLRRALERAARNIADVHAAMRPQSVTTSPEAGITIVRRPDPLDRVGVYAPGGRAAYPSSVLMGAIPARIAGVREVILCSPPTPTGTPSDLVLAAAEIGEVDRVFAIGGAGAIAAMAFGTATVPRVDRIVGPGNAYVAEAKLQLCGHVGIDSPAGPSELCVIADASAAAHAIAIELAAQAEHDPEARVVAIAVGTAVADRILDALNDVISSQPRRAIIEASLAAGGAVLAADSLRDAIAFANAYAAEHVLLALDDAEQASAQMRAAGTVFVGQRSSVAFGDYMTGANHVLPTGGLARSYSGLSTSDFVRWTTIQTVDAAAARRLSTDVACIATAEGLPGHALAAYVAGGER